MSKLKKFFGAGNQDDDDVMYGSGSPTSAKDYEKRFEESRAAAEAEKAEKAEKKSSGDSTSGQAIAGTAATAGTAGAVATTAAEAERKPSDVEKDADKSEEPKKKGLLSKLRPSKGDKDQKDSNVADAEPTADDNELGQGAVVAGAGAVGAAGVVGAAAYESNPHEETPGDDVSKSTAGAAGVGAAGAGVGAAGAGAAAHESNPRVDTGDDVSKSTYTERSYPLASGESKEPTAAGQSSPDESHLGRDAAIAGVGAGVVGAGAYAATRDNDQVTPDTSAKDIQNPEQVDSASRLGPHVPGEFPTEEGGDPHVPGGFPASTEHPPQETSSGLGTAATAVGAGAAVGAVAAGAGGAAASTAGSGERQGLVPTREHDHFFGRPPASPPASPPATQTEFAKPVQADDHSGRDGAIAAAAAATAGAGGVAGYEASRDKDTGAGSKQTDEEKDDPGHDAALAAATAAAAGGAGTYAATRDNDKSPDSPSDNRVSTDASGHQRLHKKSEERSGEKKPGFISKLLHRDKNKKDNETGSEEPSSPSSASRAAASAAAAGTGAGGTGAAASSSAAPPNRTGLPVGEDGLIHIVNEGAPPDAPALVMKGDGTEILKDREEL